MYMFPTPQPPSAGRAAAEYRAGPKGVTSFGRWSKLVLHSSFAAVELSRPDSHSGGAFDCQGPV
eukprot:7331215-Prymnesium_polylepis.1